MTDGCYNGFSVDGLSPAAAVEALATRCAQGMSALLPSIRTAHVERAGTVEVAFRVEDPSRCLRVLAAAAGASDIIVGLSHEQESISEEDLVAPFALLGPRGPLCVGSPGQYTIVIRSPHGEATTALQVYRAD